MGIQGLLPFLKKIHQPVNIADFQGCTVAIDAYCWLHKGAFSCAEKLALGEKTDQYVYYCMKYIDYMLRKGLKPILVFDGCHLKSKADVEKTRRERREHHRKKAAQFLREGKRSEAKECLQRCVDITPQMALELMNACRAKGVDCIVAPYEADAQLAFLNLRGIAQVIVTEDSDLLLFGCEKIIFKMDFHGNGTLIEKSRLNEVLTLQGGFYTFEKFRYMCILSGCDYHPSLPGIGLNKAWKVVKTARQPDIRQLLKKLPTYLKMNITVTEEYVDGFIRANNTFLYQLVYDPLTRRLCPLHPYPPEINKEDLHYAGEYFPEEKAYQIALGNVDIHNHQCIAFFNPETFVPKTITRPKFRYQLSIWDKNYEIKSSSPCKESKQSQLVDERLSVHDKEQIINVKSKLNRKSPSKSIQTPLQKSPDVNINEELMSLYSMDNENFYPEAKKAKRNIMDSFADLDPPAEDDDGKDPVSFVSDHMKTSTPEKSQDSPQNLKPGRESSDSENSEDNIDRKKRKRSVTPSKRPTAANIGEDAFRENSENRENICQIDHSPGRSRNIFAVPTDAAKPTRFHLDAPAVQVKSRYFSTSSEVVSTKSSPSSKKINSTLTSDKKNPQPNTIRLMFENAPIRPKQKERVEPQPKVLTGLQKYLSTPGSQFPSAKESFKSLKLSSLEHIRDDRFDKKATSQSSSQSSRPSVFSRFQSRFSQSGSTKPKQPSSAFTWSKSRFDSGIASANIEDSVNENCDRLDKDEEVGLRNTPVTKECSNCKNNHVDDKPAQPGQESEGRHQSLQQERTKSVPPLSSFFKTSQNLCVKPEDSTPKETLVTSSESLEDSNEVIQLRSYEYDDYLKTFERGKENSPSGSASPDNSDILERVSPEASTLDEEICSASQVLDDSSRRTEGGSPQDTSVLSEVDDRRSSLSEMSQRSNLWSIDSDCFPTSQDFIDLTDTEPDSQNSSISNSSRSSNTSKKRPACRVSGLSRSKSKTSASKKASAAMSGQRSIKDLMSRFQYTRRETLQCDIKCDICDKDFSSNQHLYKHKQIHTREKSYMCDICGKDFFTKQQLQGHKRIHTGETPYKCDICGKRFSRSDRLQLHIRDHTGEEPYRCGVCGSEFCIRCSLKKAQKSLPGDLVRVGDLVEGQSVGVQICNRIHIKEKPGTNVSEEELAQNGDVPNHRTTYAGGKSFISDVNDVDFVQGGDLQTDEKDHIDHTEGEPYKYDVLPFDIAKIEDPQSHSEIHSEKESYDCEALCDLKPRMSQTLNVNGCQL